MIPLQSNYCLQWIGLRNIFLPLSSHVFTKFHAVTLGFGSKTQNILFFLGFKFARSKGKKDYEEEQEKTLTYVNRSIVTSSITLAVIFQV